MLNWGMTLEKLRSKIFEDEDFQKQIVKKRENTKMGKSEFDFVMACILGGVSSDAANKYINLVFKFKNNESALQQNVALVFRNGDNRITQNHEFNKTLQKLPADTTLSKILESVTQNEFYYMKDDKKIELKDINNVVESLKFIADDQLITNNLGGHEMKEDVLTICENLIINGVKQIILTGAPGTGKTYTAKSVAEQLGAELTWKSKEDGSEKHPQYEFVQFHPSYDYTDFVEGFRPVKIKTDDDRNGSNIGFERKDGTFKRFCKEIIRKNKEENSEKINKYFFIIDEINRADISKVFGELMYALEPDYRGSKHRVDTQYQNLIEEGDEYKGGFYIPDNVYIIGTMNDIDRSVETFDFALRRRFVWVEVKANEVMKSVINTMLEKKLDHEIIEGLINSAIKLNTYIDEKGGELNLNHQFHLGPAYFGKIDTNIDYTEAKKELWDYRIKPLLIEYVRGYDEQRIDKFITTCNHAFLGEVHE